jgi:DNA-binding XRE family transcriptional regulator
MSTTPKNKIKKSTTSQESKLVWHTKEEVFSRVKNTPAFEAAYREESARLEIASAVKSARKEQKLTQAVVAKRAAMPQSAIARLESGSHGVSLETLNKVAVVLGKQIKLV